MRSLLLLVSLVVALPADAAPIFVALGDLPAGTFESHAAGISSDGSTVVGTGHSFFGEQAFRWTLAGGMAGLGYLPGGASGSGSSATGVSADGSVVVGHGTAIYALVEGLEAWRWTADGGMVGLRDLRYPGPFLLNSAANGVSADGSLVVGRSQSNSSTDFNDEAFRWTADGGMVGLGFLPASGRFGGRATGVSADGSVVVGWDCCPAGAEAFRWTAGSGMVGLGYLPGNISSAALAVSADGAVIVGGSGNEAFRWTAGSGMVGLGDLAGGNFSSSALAMSGDGSIVVGRGNSASGDEAFVWDSVNGVRELDQVLTNLGLNLAGWTLTEATGISFDGQTIVGTGINPSGQTEAWLAMVPEPGTGLLVMAGLLGLAARRKPHA